MRDLLVYGSLLSLGRLAITCDFVSGVDNKHNSSSFNETETVGFEPTDGVTRLLLSRQLP